MTGGNDFSLIDFLLRMPVIAIVILLMLKGAVGSRYSPPPQGGPGGDMGMAKTVKKAFRKAVGIYHDEDGP